MDKLGQVNTALGRYYEAKGAAYDDVFQNFCDENGIFFNIMAI